MTNTANPFAPYADEAELRRFHPEYRTEAGDPVHAATRCAFHIAHPQGGWELCERTDSHVHDTASAERAAELAWHKGAVDATAAIPPFRFVQ